MRSACLGLAFVPLLSSPGCSSQQAAQSGDEGGSGGGEEQSSGQPFGVRGGVLPNLVFAAVGDTRPPSWDDVPGYPTTQITRIYQDIAALQPMPSFVIGTGDYQFSSTGSGSTAPQQLAMYAQARAAFSGPFFPAMGNHECTGGTASNCVAGSDGTGTANFRSFISILLAPLHQTSPYYEIHVDAADGSWTAKLVIVAANAWDGTQQAWLASTLAQPTTYTFVVRHEPHDASPAPPGVAASEAILAQYPYTLCIVGHSHTYGHHDGSPKEVLFGNGGAPLASKDYGFGLFARRADGAIVVDAIDWLTGAADASFHFVVRPDGTPAK
jgi:hypothetical protein